MKIRKRYIILPFLLLGICLNLYQCHNDYYAEYNYVKNELIKIQEIEILEINGTADITLEDIYTTIRLKTGDTLMIFSVAGTFTSTKSITLAKLNNWKFHITGCTSGGHWAESSLNIGVSSQFSDISKLSLYSLKDVINRISDLKIAVDRISTYPNFDTVEINSDNVYIQKYDMHKSVDGRKLKWADCP